MENQDDKITDNVSTVKQTEKNKMTVEGGGGGGGEETGGVASSPPPSRLKAGGGRAGVHSVTCRRADMTAVRELVLVLGLLVSAHCEVRARDPEVEEDEEELGAKGGGGGGAAASHPIFEGLHPRASETSPLGDRGNHPARTG